MFSRISTIIKKRPVKWLLELLVFLLVFLIVRSWMQRDVISGPVPAVTGVSLAAEKIDISQPHDQPLLLHIWASWCPVCRFEQDSIQSISKDHRVVTIAMQSGTDDEVRQFLRDNNLSFSVINDPDGQLSSQFGIRGVPASFVINRKGEIAYSEVGYTSEWGLRFRLWLAGQD